MAIDRTDKAQIGRMKFLEKKRQADQKAQDRKRNIERLKYPARRTIGRKQQEMREAIIEAIINEEKKRQHLTGCGAGNDAWADRGYNPKKDKKKKKKGN